MKIQQKWLMAWILETDLVWILVLPPTGCATEGKLFNLSESWFPLLQWYVTEQSVSIKWKIMFQPQRGEVHCLCSCWEDAQYTVGILKILPAMYILLWTSQSILIIWVSFTPYQQALRRMGSVPMLRARGVVSRRLLQCSRFRENWLHLTHEAGCLGSHKRLKNADGWVKGAVSKCKLRWQAFKG